MKKIKTRKMKKPRNPFATHLWQKGHTAETDAKKKACRKKIKI